jgi:uncharacterized protein YukE
VHIDPASIVRRIGGMPIGDPGAMRSHAARLHTDASHLMDLVGAAHGRAHETIYQGPAADRFRAEIDDCLHVAQQRVNRLHQAADHLAAAASNVEASQARWHRLYRRVEADLIAAAKAAARH